MLVERNRQFLSRGVASIPLVLRLAGLLIFVIEEGGVDSRPEPAAQGLKAIGAAFGIFWNSRVGSCDISRLPSQSWRAGASSVGCGGFPDELAATSSTPRRRRRTPG